MTRTIETSQAPARIPGRAAGGARARRRRRPPGLPWIIPALVLSAGIIYYGIGYTGYVSTLNWDGTSPNPPSVGFGNYTEAFHDPVFWQAVTHTVVFFAVTFTVETVLGLLFAVLLHSGPKLAVLYKIVIFVPVVIAPAIMAPVFREVFGVNGQLNTMLQHVGLGTLAQPWLAQSSTALPALMAITIWEWTGLTFMLYFAAISHIPPEVAEAARIDGAGNVRVLTRIVWPQVRGTTAVLAILGVIGALKTFDVPYLVTLGGPNFATEFLSTYIFRTSITNDEVGYGAALSILLLVIALVIGIALHSRTLGRSSFSDV